MKAALFCLGNLSALWIASSWAGALASRRLDFVVGVAALFPVCAISITLIAGFIGQLYPAPVTLALAIVAAVLMVKPGRNPRHPFFEGLNLTQNTAARIATFVVIAFASIPLV